MWEGKDIIKVNSYMKNKPLFLKSGGLKDYRHQMVEYALKHGISSAAKIFNTTRKTVRKWVVAYKEKGFDGLKNQSRLGQKHPNKLSKRTENRIIRYREKTQLGAYFIKDALSLKCSEKTIHKKIKQHGLVVKPKTKAKKKKDMSEMRASIAALERIQIDVKYLTDIPKYYKNWYFNGFPKYQITARDYKSGWTVVGYSMTNDSTNVGIFVAYVLMTLKCAGVDISKVTFQSDNGSEFRSSSTTGKLSLYEEILTLANVNFRFIPVRRPTFNSDVESFHGRIEKELYDIEDFVCVKNMFLKSWFYMTRYNSERKNRNKGNLAPADILRSYKIKNVDKLVTTRPLFVDEYIIRGAGMIEKNEKWMECCDGAGTEHFERKRKFEKNIEKMRKKEEKLRKGHVEKTKTPQECLRKKRVFWRSVLVGEDVSYDES
jgi:transposase